MRPCDPECAHRSYRPRLADPRLFLGILRSNVVRPAHHCGVRLRGGSARPALGIGRATLWDRHRRFGSRLIGRRAVSSTDTTTPYTQTEIVSCSVEGQLHCNSAVPLLAASGRENGPLTRSEDVRRNVALRERGIWGYHPGNVRSCMISLRSGPGIAAVVQTFSSRWGTGVTWSVFASKLVVILLPS